MEAPMVELSVPSLAPAPKGLENFLSMSCALPYKWLIVNSGHK